MLLSCSVASTLLLYTPSVSVAEVLPDAEYVPASVLNTGRESVIENQELQTT